MNRPRVWAVVGALLALTGWCGPAHAATAALSWNANGETDLGGYIAFWGGAPGTYANQSDVGTATSVTVPSLTEGDTYYFAIKAYDTSNNLSAFSAEVSLTVPVTGGGGTDTTAPSVTAVNTTSATTVVVTFSEAVDPATAEDPSNYVIDGGAVAVVDAVLDGDGVTVRLTTASQAVDSFHTLVVSGVADLADPPNLAADDVSYQAAFNLLVTVVAPTDYDAFPVVAGDTYLTDRLYTVAQVPAEYRNALWVRTANSDKSVTDENFLTFSVDRDVIVFVGYDRHAASVPDWLGDAFVPTGEGPTNDVDDVSPFTMWARNYPAGDVVLGGNDAAGADGATYNYVVLVVPMAAATSLDADGDLIPDTWEVAMGLDPTRFDAHDDPDGDGLTNLQESWLGTDPLTAATVGAGNTAPAVTLDGSVVGVAGSEVVLDGTAATDPDGDPLTVRWRQTAGPMTVAVADADQLTARFTPAQTGVYAFTLTVSDGNGGIAVATTDVEVYEDLLAYTITALGANLVVSEGALTGAVLSIPVGAMDKTYGVGVGSTDLPKTLPSGDTAVSGVVHFSPSDMPLLGMATIRVPYTRDAAIGFDNLELLRYDPETDTWVAVDIGRDLSTSIEATVNLLGTFVVVQKGGGAGGGAGGGGGGAGAAVAGGGGCAALGGTGGPQDASLLLLLAAALVRALRRGRGRRVAAGPAPRTRPEVSLGLFFLAGLLALSAPADALAAATNSLTIHEEAGVTTANYPIQIGRPFEQGEIAECPKALIGGSPVTTQADVKQRWPDGSVKHAILTFHIPTLNAGTSVTVTFQNQACDNTGFLTAAAMTSGAFADFDAQIALTSGTTKTASARTMIGAGAFSYWMQGPVATSVIVADHSAAGAYDIGFDSYKPFRPIFHATFFPLTGQVRVRFIGEIASTEALENMGYSLALKTGLASPATVYSKSSFTHTAGSRWTREFWIGGTPPQISIDNNIAYLTEARAVPHYSVTHSDGSPRQISETTIADDYSNWLSKARDLGDGGAWTKNMPQTGGRPDIGPLPGWTAKWLYSGDWRLKEIAFELADLAAQWPRHFREGDAAKWMDSDQTVQGLGHVFSIRDRPSLTVVDLGSVGNPPDGTAADDRVDFVGSASTGGWTFEISHLPEPFAPQYALTGDYWYLEEMWFWSAAAAAYTDGRAVTAGYGRGPTGAEGVIYLSTRAEAWVLRSRTWAAYWSPDGTPEQDYFTALLDDAASDMEGKHHITGTRRENNAVWTWAYEKKYTGKGYGGSPLHIWRADSSCCTDNGASTGFVPWMYHYLIYATAQASQLGYDFGDLLSWEAEYLTGYLIGDGAGEMNPYLIANYGSPAIVAATNDWAQTWAGQRSLYTPGTDPRQQDATSFSQRYDFTGGYPYIAHAAMSGVYSETNGRTAWEWIDGILGEDAGWDENPMWAIAPVGGIGTPPPVDVTAPLAPTGVVVTPVAVP